MFVTRHIKELFKEGMCPGHTWPRLRHDVNASVVTISESTNIKSMHIADEEDEGKW